jgi:hypothetical protein
LVLLFGRTIKIVFNSLEELPDRCVTHFILAGVECLRRSAAQRVREIPARKFIGM